MTVRTSIEKATKSVLGAIALQSEGQSDILDTLQAEHDEVQDLLEKLVGLMYEKVRPYGDRG